MARLNPLVPKDLASPNSQTTSIHLHNDLVEKIDDEMRRIGVRSRSKLISMILEEYFKEPL